MNRFRYTLLPAFVLLCSFVFFIHSLPPAPPSPDEGMWTFNNLPVKLLKEKYGFTPTQEWLDHIRLASVRINDGGSGSFVSADGLVLTNHHVARGQLQKMSTAQQDYVKEGFYAKTAADEIKCPDLELNVLESMEDVTQRMVAEMSKAKNDNEAMEIRKARIASIEKESLEKTGLRSDVVPLYSGGEYWLYQYKKYTDVRIVFAPEGQIAFFGGDPDNFTYPRYDIDMALFRVYENDKPVHPKHHLKWSAHGADDGELVLVSGHPGSTQRLTTVMQLDFQRDQIFPMTLQRLKNRIASLRQYSERGAEQARQARSMIFGLENSLKAQQGEFSGLLDKAVMAKKEKEESDFRAKIAANPEWQKEFGGIWDDIARAQKKDRDLFKSISYGGLTGCRLTNLANLIVQYVVEVAKPDADRLEQFHDSQLESLQFGLYSSAPVYPEFEEARFVNTLQLQLDQLGPDDPYMMAILNGRTPADVAKELIGGTTLADPAVRKALVEGGEKAVAASTDPLIVMARKVDPIARKMKKEYDENVQSVYKTAGEKFGKAWFAVFGKSTYPDATFTLRLSFGTVKGYPMNGTQAPPVTTFNGMYDRASSFSFKPPYDLPQRYIDGKGKLDLNTPVDFVASTDIIGGNSGSPVINKNGELVGLVFDGNIESLVGAYVFNEENNRTVAVHSRAMIEVLRKLYDAAPLADELEGRGL